MKIYTRTGDGGKTSLYDGRRIDKASVVFDTIGELDELNSRLGLAAVHSDSNYLVSNAIRRVQCKLQDINAILATINKDGRELPEITEEDVTLLEKSIDDYSMVTPKLKAFILPGVTVLDAQLHICRTQARKCERSLFSLNRSDVVLKDHKDRDVDLGALVVDPIILKYINRLSDYLFALARYTCHKSGSEDIFEKDFK
jgi:cob(I)alamin adenosyltransferase